MCNKETKELSWVKLHLKLLPRERGKLLKFLDASMWFWGLLLMAGVSLWIFSAPWYLRVLRNFWQMWKRRLFRYGSAAWRWRGRGCVENRSQGGREITKPWDQERFPRHLCWHRAYWKFLCIIWKGFRVKYLKVQSTLELWWMKIPHR